MVSCDYVTAGVICRGGRMRYDAAYAAMLRVMRAAAIARFSMLIRRAFA